MRKIKHLQSCARAIGAECDCLQFIDCGIQPGPHQPDLRRALNKLFRAGHVAAVTR